MTARRRLGFALAAVGGLLLATSGAGYASGWAARADARARWASEEARAELAAINGSLDGVFGEPRLAPGAPVARLIIPVLGLDEIVLEGVTERQLRAGPGHLPGSAIPGATGNAIVSAHRDRHFYGLDRLTVGDTIITETRHTRTVWRLEKRRVIERHAPALFDSPAPRLTLTTCWPVRWFGPAPDRLILTAAPVRTESLVRS